MATTTAVWMLDPSWWRGAADRALKATAQTLLLLWAGSDGLNVLTVQPMPALGLAAGAAVLSLLTSIVSAPVGDPGTTCLIPGGS